MASKLDKKEFQVPEIRFVRDIENRVFQGIVVECLIQIPDVSLAGEVGWFGRLLGRQTDEPLNSIRVEQNAQTVSIHIELNVNYGVSLPDKAEEIQSAIAEAVTRLTGLHVETVHVVYKNLLRNKLFNSPSGETKKIEQD